MFNRVFRFWVRREACKMAAEAAKGPWSAGRDVSHLLWSLTVFFEEYMVKGAVETQADFGPKEPVELGIVKAGKPPASA